ncbi:MAG: hypothetical protein KA140_07115 [Caldisericia bacterium]|nr:hypothetical protein [Caldisericia bacterium]
MTASGKIDPENKLSKPLRFVSTIILSMLVLFEGFRAYSQLNNWIEGSKIALFIYSLFACGFIIFILIKTLLGNRKALVLWFILGILNLITTMTSLYMVEYGRIEIAFGMPLTFAYVYYALQALLAILLGFYGWSLTRPSVAHEMEAKRKAKDFGEFLASKKDTGY